MSRPHLINPHIFRAYDIRGIADKTRENPDLTEETAYLLGRGVASYLIRTYQTRTMSVGYDVRISSPALCEAYTKGLTESGINVTHLGLITSPMLYWSTCVLDFEAGTNITASHNPKEYNGFKIVTRGAHSVCGDELQKIRELIENQDFETLPVPGSVDTKNIWPEYKKDLLSRLTLARPLHVVIDAGNGATSTFAEEFFKELGCTTTCLYCEPDGNFPNHEANPEELHNMQDLIAKVKETQADLGIGFDGDGDRVGIVDEKGRLYAADYLLLLLVRELVTRVEKPQIVFDVKVSQTIINAMEEAGALPVMSKTGHSFIESRMRELNAPLGGEVSGHMFFGGEDYYGFDDAFLAAAKLLHTLSKSEKPLSAHFEDLPKTCTTPEFKAHCPDNRKFAIIKELVTYFTERYDCITIDGVRIRFDARTWAAIRASNTSPNLTLRFEADTPEKLHEIQEIMVAKLREYPEVSLAWYTAPTL